MELLCPICGRLLGRTGREYRCEDGHSFDIARQGYVNLLAVQQKKSLHPGDTREQVLARRVFLDAGYYTPIVSALCRIAQEVGAEGPVVDVGCGEGYYSTRLRDALGAELVGLDISKEAVRCASARDKNARWLCATAAHLPLPDGCAGTVSSLFALTVAGEFHRVLRKNGILLQVLAAEDHLMGLKSVIYPEIHHIPKDSVPEIPGFSLIKSENVRFSFTVEGEQVQNLLSMTPHVYRIGKDGAARLAATERLTDTASCVISAYRRV